MHNMSHGREKFLNIKHVHISRHDEDQAKERDTTIPTATTTEVLVLHCPHICLEKTDEEEGKTQKNMALTLVSV